MIEPLHGKIMAERALIKNLSGSALNSGGQPGSALNSGGRLCQQVSWKFEWGFLKGWRQITQIGPGIGVAAVNGKRTRDTVELSELSFNITRFFFKPLFPKLGFKQKNVLLS